MTGGNPDLGALRLFVRVAEAGNLSRAAAVLGTTQPSVSRTLRSLENDLHATLFHRTGRGVTLTEAGERTLASARALLAHADQFVADVRDWTHTPTGTVTVALLTTYLRILAGDLFEEVSKRYPGIVLRIQESFSIQHEDWLSNGWVDIALVTRYRKPRIDNGDLLAAADLMVVGNPDIERGGEGVPFHALGAVPLVLPATPNGLRVRVEDEARRQGVRLNVALEADSVEAQHAIISRDRIYALWSQHSVRTLQLDTRFAARRIVEPRLPRYVVLKTTTHHPLSRASREVARILRRLVIATHAQ